MSSIAIMQPYLFPYVGYVQLIHAADRFVFYDDVQYIKGGWINRNRILINRKPSWFTVPCHNESYTELINQVEHAMNSRSRKKLLKKLKFTYARAPFFDRVYSGVEQVLKTDTAYIGALAMESVMWVSEYLDLDCQFTTSTGAYGNREMDAADRLIDICRQEGAYHYINMIGGRELYQKEYFSGEGIQLDFLKPEAIPYEQFGEDFVPWLSIIDILMFNSPEKIRTDLLPTYNLV